LPSCQGLLRDINVKIGNIYLAGDKFMEEKIHAALFDDDVP